MLFVRFLKYSVSGCGVINRYKREAITEFNQAKPSRSVLIGSLHVSWVLDKHVEKANKGLGARLQSRDQYVLVHSYT